jgi:hypothetical protein
MSPPATVALYCSSSQHLRPCGTTSSKLRIRGIPCRTTQERSQRRQRLACHCPEEAEVFGHQANSQSISGRRPRLLEVQSVRSWLQISFQPQAQIGSDLNTSTHS